MSAVLVAVLILAAWLVLRPPHGLGRRVRKAFAGSTGRHSKAHSFRMLLLRGTALNGQPDGGGSFRNNRRNVQPGHGHASRPKGGFIPLTVVVQQLAALLKGGRSPSRLWDELWLVYAGSGGSTGQESPPHGQRLGAASTAILAAARGAAFRGAPVAEAIRLAVRASGLPAGSGEPRIWTELAACFEIAEASGCPLADVLARFAAQLEVEDDAEAARQTALAGPKATVTLLTWLPLLGLGLGICLGVDPLAMLIGTPIGIAALVAGILLTVTGRIWSARLVRAAAGAAVA
jgi:tight adherence protein B